MRSSLKSVVAGVVTLCVAGAMTVAGATTASAAAPPYDPDPNAYGTLTFYDAAGAVVTSGGGTTGNDPRYIVASTDSTTPVAIKKAALFGFLPVAGTDPGSWVGFQLSTNTTYPITTAPAPVSSSAFPAAQRNTTDASFKDLTLAFPQVTTGALANVYQIRLKQGANAEYASASVTINPTTGAWQQVFPVVRTATTTALAVNPASPATAPASPTLTATVATGPPATPAAAGSVQFLDGTTALGGPVAVAAGVATKALTGVAAGAHSYTATFTPTDTVTFAPSTSSVVPFQVNAPLPTPTIALAANPTSANVGDPVTFTASFTTTITPPGTFQFFDGTTSLGAAGSATTLTTSTLTAGLHSVTARFVPADPTAFNGATSQAVSVNVLQPQVGACATTPTNCTDPQAFTAEVAAGSLVISTPFHTTNPFNLGVLALNSLGTELTSGAKSFVQQDPAHAGITITDTRAGNNAWTANLQSSAFSSGAGTIDPKGLGFTGVGGSYTQGNALQAGDVVFTDNPAFSNATPATVLLTGLASSKVFASAASPGVGTVFVNGNFTLNAPTSTPAGIYTGTVTFTIA